MSSSPSIGCGDGIEKEYAHPFCYEKAINSDIIIDFPGIRNSIMNFLNDLDELEKISDENIVIRSKREITEHLFIRNNSVIIEMLNSKIYQHISK